MSAALTGTLIVAIAALTGFLVPLLWQLRKTAAALEQAAASISADVRRVAEDVRETKAKVDRLVAALEPKAEKIGGYAGLLEPAASALQTALGYFLERRLLATRGRSAIIQALFGVLSFLVTNLALQKGGKNHE